MIRFAEHDRDFATLRKLADTSPYTHDWTNKPMYGTPADFEAGRNVVDVAEDGAIRGFYCARQMKQQPVTRLNFITVHPDHLGSNTGARLMRHLEAHATHRVIEFLVGEANTRALRFYEKLGYEKVGHNGLKRAHVMQKTLGPRSFNIRGTSGSGKSTLVRQVMADFRRPLEPTYVEGRRKPLYYRVEHPRGGRPLSIMGHYESQCGGCDTISGFDYVYDLIRQRLDEDTDVLFEGLLLSVETSRGPALVEEGRSHAILVIDVPMETCLERVLARRKARGDERTFNPANITKKHMESLVYGRRSEERGVPTSLMPWEDLVKLLRQSFGLKPGPAVLEVETEPEVNRPQKELFG